MHIINYPKMGPNIQNRLLSLNQGKTTPISTKLYQTPSITIPYGMPFKKTPKETRTKNWKYKTAPNASFLAGLNPPQNPL